MTYTKIKFRAFLNYCQSFKLVLRVENNISITSSCDAAFAQFFRKDPLVGYKPGNFLPKESCLRLLVCFSRLNSASNVTKQDNVQINSRLNLNTARLL